jgi:SAM-dependent methyltransferase
MHSLIDIGYSGPWSWGHLPVAAAALLLAWAAWRFRWPRALAILAGLVLVWSLAGFLVVQFVFRFNAVPPLPAPAFLAAGQGRVLDMGAGSGRSSLMVLMARPGVTVVALDNFSATYIAGNGPDKTRANFKAAGFERQTDVVSADMRSMPFPDASFDAIVSVTAIDHLDRDGIPKALAEAARVIRPRGQFFLEVMHPDGWMRLAWGPMLMHNASASRIEEAWPARLREAGFDVRETGTRPATFWMLAERKPPAP